MRTPAVTSSVAGFVGLFKRQATTESEVQETELSSTPPKSNRDLTLERMRMELEQERWALHGESDEFMPRTMRLDRKKSMAEVVDHEKSHSLRQLTGNSSFRRQLSSLLHSNIVEVITACVVLANVVAIVMEADLGADLKAGEGDIPAWIDLCGYVFLAFYVAELCIKLYAWRWHFFDDQCNSIDLFVVSLDVAGAFLMMVIPGGDNDDWPTFTMMRLVRLVRLVRLLRAFKVFKNMRELRLMLTGMMSTFRAIFYGLVLVAAMLLLWSIVAVEVLHPLNRQLAERGIYDDEHRPKAYASVGRAFLTFMQQVLIVDAWGDVSMPLIEAYPLIAGPILIMVFVSIQLALLNLVLTAIVDSAQEYRAMEDATNAKERSIDFLKAKAALLDTCEQLDTNENGYLELQELLEGFDHNDEFQRVMRIIDVQRDDIFTLFRSLDAEGSGSISYNAFIDHLHNMKLGDTKALLVFLKSEVMNLNRKYGNILASLQQDILSIRLVAIEEAMQKTEAEISVISASLSQMACGTEPAPQLASSRASSQHHAQVQLKSAHGCPVPRAMSL